MPLYEYQCDACAHRFELIRKFSDPPLDACPQCGGSVRKLVSSPAFQFKGTGWYITDYARKPSGGTGAAEKGGAEKGGSASKDGATSSDTGSPASSDKGSSGSGDSAPSSASSSTSNKPS